ncbi:MAG: hypothetical protein CMH81_07330 [Nitrospiraceae bacterium]|nr:hypothetical protein [Nitrospiraceae bacterium]|tara:strand:- start:1321 stop:1566 length:246 start_codon:yes stop_codon:yes gene_type:complete
MATDESPNKTTLFREWIIFAIAMGAGAHISLGLILHAPDKWDWGHTAVYTFLIGLSVYITIQVGRSCWWFLMKRRSGSQPD